MAAKPKKKQSTSEDIWGDDMLSLDVGFDNESESDALDGVDVAGDCRPSRELPEDGLPAPGTFEQDINAQIGQIGLDIRAARKKAADRMKVALDYDTSFQVVFTSIAQRDAFLKASGWEEHGRRYINGLDLAKRLKIKLPPCEYKVMPNRVDPVWADLAIEDDYEI